MEAQEKALGRFPSIILTRHGKSVQMEAQEKALADLTAAITMNARFNDVEAKVDDIQPVVLKLHHHQWRPNMELAVDPLRSEVGDLRGYDPSEFSRGLDSSRLPPPPRVVFPLLDGENPRAWRLKIFRPLVTFGTKRTNGEATMTNQGDQVVEDAPSIEAAINDQREWVMPGLPKVRTQDGPYCVFYAIAYVLEKLTGAVINVQAYETDYKTKLRKSGNYAKIKEEMTDLEVFQNELGTDRAVTALDMLKNEGVMAEQNGLEGRVFISGYKCHNKKMDYAEVCAMLRHGVPILGSFAVGGNFDKLNNDIYETVVGSHMVMFVGYGCRHGDKRPYLVFLNSHGTNWGTNGLGRIYFNQVFQKLDRKAFQFITLQVGEVGTHHAKVSPDLHVPTSELTHQPNVKRFKISDPGQPLNGKIEIRLQESAATYNEIGKSSKAYQSVEELKLSLLAGTMEPEASKEELWRIEQSAEQSMEYVSIAKYVRQAAMEQGAYEK